MTARDITLIGNPILSTKAAAVADPTTSEIRVLAADMIETMQTAGGIGIAAPQVNASLRLIVAMPIALREEWRDLPPVVLVNPALEPIGDEREDAIEGCLSFPGVRGIVPRWSKVAWRAQDLDGQPISGVAQGLFARVLQHEVDHLDGILFLSRMTDLTRLAMDSEAHHLTKTIGEVEDRT
ncbi:MAG: peptide deformylase [Methylocella sp.]